MHENAGRAAHGANARAFEVTREQLCALTELEREMALSELANVYGGVRGLAASLHVDTERGLPTDDASDMDARRAAFGCNSLPQPRSTSLLRLFWEALHDTTLVILMLAGAISLVLGLTTEEDKSTSWIEGCSILLSVLTVTLITAVNDYQKERQFRAMNTIKDDLRVRLLRNGTVSEVSTHDIVVGDIALIDVGDIVPADGLLVDGNDIQIDESAFTGETHLVAKGPENPIIFSSTKVMEGAGRMLVIAVGPNSQAGIIASLVHGATAAQMSGTAGGSRESSSASLSAQLPDRDAEERAELGVADSVGTGPRPWYARLWPWARTRRAARERTDNEDSVALIAMPKTPTPHDQQLMADDSRPGPALRQNSRSLSAASLRVTDLRAAPPNKSVLQSKLEWLSVRIGYAGMACGVAAFVIMSLRFSIDTFAVNHSGWSSMYVNDYLNYFIVGVTVLVVAVPEGLPLAVTLALAFSVRRMLADGNLVRHLHACETMGNATTVCTDKTGTLTTNQMTVMHIWLGGTTHAKAPPVEGLSGPLRRLLVDGIAINSNAELRVPAVAGAPIERIGNKTECALLQMIADLGEDYGAIRRAAHASIVRLVTFSSARKRMSVVVALPGGGYRAYVKGASEILLELCTQVSHADGHPIPLDRELREAIQTGVIAKFAADGLRTLVLAYRDLDGAPGGVGPWSDVDADAIESSLVCIAVVGIEDPLRDNVVEAIQQCQRAQIVVRMVTGDNAMTARSIASKCGILKESQGHTVLEGPAFRQRVLDANGNLRQDEFDAIAPNLRVLARSSPKDKYTLVSGLLASQALGPRQVVAVTGDGTNDAPALKRADVGFAMGQTGTSVAKDASDIILMNDDFASIVKAVMWGRNIYDSVGKFLQFQLTVNLVAVTVAVVGAMALEESPLSAVQLLWVNLIMDSLASLALATEAPTADLLKRAPYGRDKALVSRRMALNIIGQTVYQLAMLFLLVFYGDVMFQVPSGRGQPLNSPPSVHYTLVFNTFVFMQLFNQVSSRKLHDETNIFGGLLRNRMFVYISLLEVFGQVIIVEFGGVAFSTVALSGMQWLACVGLGSSTLLVGYILRLVPSKILPHFMRFVRRPEAELPISHGRELWIRNLSHIRWQLFVLRQWQRGNEEARWAQVMARLSRHSRPPGTSSPLASAHS